VDKLTAFEQQEFVPASAAKKSWTALKFRQLSEPMELAIPRPLS
jgi:hypothetical protein